jgi:hypothetical protein
VVSLSTLRGAPGSIFRRLSLLFGLLIGAAWTAEILFGNLGDTPVLGNFRTLHFHAYRIIEWSFIYGAVTLTALAGLVAAYRIGDVSDALSMSVGSGLIGWVIIVIGATAMEIVFHDALRQCPSGGCDALAVPLLAHLAIVVILGIAAGGVGAALGMFARRFRYATTS